MSFSKEDKAAWLDSEVMKEFEKVAEEELLEGPPSEAFEPIPVEVEEALEKEEEGVREEEENVWEEEEDMERFEEALEKFEEKPVLAEFKKAYDKMLIQNLEKIAHRLADKNNAKATYRVELALHGLQELFKEENNG